MSGPVARLLPDGARMHLQHGPIDLIIGAEGPGAAREAAFSAAVARFQGLLDELVADLPALRRPAGETGPVTGAVAARMVAAARPFAEGVFVTPMAAVAGSVAEAVLAGMGAAAPLTRAYVNNGGDIALHLSAGETFTIAMASAEGRVLGRVAVGATDPIRGIATSGQRGRSFSFGIADSVTVLAATAATADVAATLIGNAVDLPDHPAIQRRRACEIQPDTDLGARPVVRGVGLLTGPEIAAALDCGATTAQHMIDAGHIVAAALFLRGQSRIVGQARPAPYLTIEETTHA
jgi:ApbE superfamily uncharacterized protein (UPF0280 family)